MRKLYRSLREKKIGGVCEGLGEYFEIDPIFFRIFFISLLFLSGFGILVYIIMWALVPINERDKNVGPNLKRIYLSNQDAKVAGVCGGLGEYFDIDPVFFRVSFILLAFFLGFGLVAYVILWLIIPRPKDE